MGGDWGGDSDTRKSTSGWIFFVDECIIAWGSKAQKTVTMSSCTTEYVALSDVMKEILYVNMVCSFMAFDVLLPITIFCDNMGEIVLSNNLESKRTKCLDIRYHFIREYVDDGTVKVTFVPSMDNKADNFTKNTSITIFQSNVEYMKE